MSSIAARAGIHDGHVSDLTSRIGRLALPRISTSTTDFVSIEILCVGAVGVGVAD